MTGMPKYIVSAMPTRSSPWKFGSFAKCSISVREFVPTKETCAGLTPVSASNRAWSVSNRMRLSPTIATWAWSAARRASAQACGLSPRSPARSSRRVRAVHSQPLSSNATAKNTNVPIFTHGRAGMSRVGTGCAWPGRSDAVFLSPGGSAPSRVPVSPRSEGEVDECTALPLLDDDREQQKRPNARDGDRWSSLDHRLERRVPHREMSSENAGDDRHGDDHRPGRDQWIGLGLHARHALQHDASARERLGAEEDPGDVDKNEGQQRQAQHRHATG